MKYQTAEPAAATSSSAASPDASAAAAPCPICDGIGWVRRDVPVAHPDFGQLYPCTCRLAEFDAERFGRLTRYSNLGSLAGVTFATLRTGGGGQPAHPLFTQALDAAQRYTEVSQGWLVLTGPAGSGKTRIAAAIASACIQQGKAVLFIPVADLLDHLRATYAPQSEVTYDVLFEQVRNVPVLILDDLGNENASPWAQEKLAQIFSHRYNARMLTVVTTDIAMERLNDRFQARLTDPSVTTLVAVAPGAGRKRDLALDRLDLRLPHMTFETFRPRGNDLVGPIAENLSEARALAKRYAEHPDGWLVFIGRHGCGKTHLASAIAQATRERGLDVLFILVPAFLDYLRSTFNQDGNPGYEASSRVERAGLLILDDFSESIATPWTREKLDLLLNQRYLNRMPTVITSSVQPETLEPRIWSRMSDPGLSSVYEIRAPDFRTGVDYPKPPPAEPGPQRGRSRKQ